MEGTLLDLSEGGAKIKVPDPDALIGEFFMEVPSDDMIIRCRFIRADGGIVGIQYVKPPRRISWLKK